MTLNTSQVRYYMTQRKKGATQHISAMKAGISVRSGRRIEKDQWSKAGERHWRTRKDPLEPVWDSERVPLLKERPALMPITLLEMLQDKYPGQYPSSLRRTMQRRVREWKLQYCQRHDIWPLFTIFNVRYSSTRLTAFLQRYLVVFWRQILAQHASFSFLS